MLTKEQQETRTAIERATRPLNQKIDRLTKDVRRLKSEVQQIKSVMNRISK